MERNLKYAFFAFMMAFISTQVIAQKFVAPAGADTMKNPLKNNPSATIEGKKLYTQYCVVCHGEKGKGDGAAVAGLPKRPADHSSAAFQKQSDGVIYWKIANGNNPMPTYKTVLKPIQIWQLVDYTRTLKAPAK
jgi:mono/diheme cytochrome c family protein